uniref:Uncharacterized protein n=1 Tax=Oryza punctata TaxID=4537 RepID=A0A0E0KZL4_ORYPU
MVGMGCGLSSMHIGKLGKGPCSKGKMGQLPMCEIAPIPNNQVPQFAIDWDALEIEPMPQQQLGSSMP